MTTARDFITLCLKEVGVTGVGQTPLDEDINDSFTILIRMLNQWQKRRWIVPNLIDVAALGNNQKSNLIGPGQYYNIARPAKIQAAYFKQLGGSLSQNNVSYPLIPIWSYEDYANKIQLKELNTWPSYFFYDAAFPYGNIFIWPIPTNQYEIHLILRGPIGFDIELEAIKITNAGFGYLGFGDYVQVPFINVSSLGSGGTANITVDETGFIASANIADPGNGYKIGDVLTINNTDVGGTGAGFLCIVTGVTSSLDAEFNMPEEFEEAIHYNLCVRLTAHYQYDPNPIQGQLAKAALNTIRVGNTQIPQLQMPSSLQFNGNSGFYIFNADQY